MPGHIFISYSHKDAAYVERLTAHLRTAGLEVWTDEGLDYGTAWPETIEKMIDSCQAFVPVMSVSSRDAAWVDREIDLAQELGKPVLPLLLSGRRFLRLRNIQDDDVTDGRLPDDRFVNRLLALAGTSGAPAPVVVSQFVGAPAPTARDAHPSPESVARGFEAGADLLRRTYGPLGRRALLFSESGEVHEAADAAEVVASIRRTDTNEAIGVGLLRGLVSRMQNEVSDGGVTSAILAQSMLRQVMARVAGGAHPVTLRRGMDMAVAAATADLDRLIFDVEEKDQITALVALACRERVIGEIVAEAFDKVGKEGLITVEAGAQYGLELELVDGMRFEQGYLSEYFVTDRERDECVLEHPYLLFVDQDLSEVDALAPILDMVIATKRPLAVIAHDVMGAALNTLVLNKTRGSLTSVAVRAPETGDRRAAMMQDMAVLTGAQVVGSRLPLGRVTLDTLGEAGKVVTTGTRTTIVDGAGGADNIIRRVRELWAAIDRGGPAAELDHLRIRLARLSGGIAVIKVGGNNEAEASQRIRMIRRAITMTRTAINEGLVPGGGAALVHVGAGLRAPIGLPSDQAAGFEVVVKALDAPCEALVGNAGRDAAAIVQQLRDKPERIAYDVVSGEFVKADPVALIDSAALPRVALAAAAEAVGRFLMIT